MIGDESSDFLRENNHRHNEHDGRPKQHRAQITPFHRAQLCAALLPESNTQKHYGKPQEQGPESLQKRARARRTQRACKSQRKAAPHRCERAHNRAQGCGDAGALLHPFSPRRCQDFIVSRIHFFLASVFHFIFSIFYKFEESNGFGNSSRIWKISVLPLRLARITGTSPQNSQINWRQAPQGGVNVSVSVTTEMASKPRSPSLMALKMAMRSAQTVRP